MKILHVVHGYPPSMGGSQWLIKNLSEQLVTRYHDEVTVFTTVAYNTEYFWGADKTAMEAGTETINGVTVRRFPVFNRLNFARRLLASLFYRLRLPYNDWFRTLETGPIIFGLQKAVAESQADVVLAATFPLLHMYDMQAGSRRAAIPNALLGAIHTADPWGYDRPMLYRAIRQADAYIALTPFERDYLIQRGIEANKIAVIGAGIDTAPFLATNGITARQKYGWGEDPVIATIGKQNSRKRLDVLIAAMRQVWVHTPQAHLLIAGGQSTYSEKLQALIHTLPPQQQRQIVVLSNFEEAEKPNLLAACDIFVLPSGEESFGIAFIEAWACGKPVIGTRSGAIPSVIAEGQDGLIVKYGDADELAQAIQTLLQAPERRETLGNAGRKKVLENYTWEIVTDQLRTVYTKITGSKETS